MTIIIATGDEISEAEIPLLDDVVPGSVDCKGRSAVRSKSGCWKSSSFIIGAGVAERLAYYGISANLVSYLTGPLGQSTATAASVLNAWFGTSSLLPILGGFVADSFAGRFRMIIVSCVLYISGLSFLSLSASLSSDSSQCKPAANKLRCSPPDLQIVFFFFSFYLVSLAQGGLTPCLQAFGADQFDEEDEDECKAKSSFFNWWTCFSAGGILVPLLILTYIQENVSWVLGFGIPAIVMCLALLLFLSGTMTYRFRVNTHGKNPFVRIHRVFIKAAKNWKADPVALSIDEEGQGILPQEGCAQFKFLDKALLAPDGSINEKICSVTDVEDAKSLLRLVPIWLACLGYSIIYSQPATLFTKQAATVDRHLIGGFELPAASLQQCFITVTITVSLVLYDRVFVPIARAITKNPSGISMLQRIGTGLLLSSTSIVIAAFIERKRLALAREYGLVDMPNTLIPMSVWWLAPQYVLSASSDVFAMVGLQEFFYDQVPSELKSIGLAMYLSILGVGSLLSSFLVSSIQKLTSANGQDGWFADNLNRAHLDYFYWLLAGISAAGFAGFVCFNRSYVYRRRINI
ncbi:protein NRT1/ PTR FAMILY 5.10 [Sesamum alatum]|uniref:Protein NRT1/ PTR FAMILY 5.10 n=1 Tax=Sesamum alatum TaxID=300844 RepID=A0AAE1XKZ8_9LAMI|nr:protein NRT1/ PTR FAMILY 5.10 [Sesamum alatum]